MNIFRVLVLAGAVAIVAVPASAKHLKRHHHHDSHAVANQAPPGWYPNGGGVPYSPGAYRPPNTGPYGRRDPYGVYFGNQEVSRDPDPNVRQELIYDYSYLYSW